MNNMQPLPQHLCSIIIPVYNRVSYTQQCLESLIHNTPDDLYEVIIVDNASTDGTKDFLNLLEGDIRIISNHLAQQEICKVEMVKCL